MPEKGEKMGSLSKKCNARAKKNQRCHSLEPVLEHSVTCLDEAPRKQPQQSGNEGKKQSKGKGILARLRDGYVSLMNDMASSADLTGVSAMYGCSTGQVDYPGSAAIAFASKPKEAEERACCISKSQKELTHKP